MTSVLWSEEQRRHRESSVNETAERRVMCLWASEAKDCWQPLESWGEAWNRPSPRSQPCPHLHLELQASRTVREYIPVVWSHQVSDNLAALGNYCSKSGGQWKPVLFSFLSPPPPRALPFVSGGAIITKFHSFSGSNNRSLLFTVWEVQDQGGRM